MQYAILRAVYPDGSCKDALVASDKLEEDRKCPEYEGLDWYFSGGPKVEQIGAFVAVGDTCNLQEVYIED